MIIYSSIAITKNTLIPIDDYYKQYVMTTFILVVIIVVNIIINIVAIIYFAPEQDQSELVIYLFSIILFISILYIVHISKLQFTKSVSNMGLYTRLEALNSVVALVTLMISTYLKNKYKSLISHILFTIYVLILIFFLFSNSKIEKVILMFDRENQKIHINKHAIKDDKLYCNTHNFILEYDKTTNQAFMYIKWFPYMLFEDLPTDQNIINNQLGQTLHIMDLLQCELTNIITANEFRQQMLIILDQLNELYKPMINEYKKVTLNKLMQNKYTKHNKEWLEISDDPQQTFISYQTEQTIDNLFKTYKEQQNLIPDYTIKFKFINNAEILQNLQIINTWGLINYQEHNKDNEDKIIKLLEVKMNERYINQWPIGKYETLQDYINYIRKEIEKDTINGEQWNTFQSILGICIEDYHSYFNANHDLTTIQENDGRVYLTSEIMQASRDIAMKAEKLQINIEGFTIDIS